MSLACLREESINTTNYDFIIQGEEVIKFSKFNIPRNCHLWFDDANKTICWKNNMIEGEQKLSSVSIEEVTNV
jgi:hypothetical protein